jgi:hypothetical protein
MSDNIKQELDTLWIKYQKTLEMLDQTLDELEQKPKEIQIPITEYVEVPKIVEVEIVKDISQDTRDSYELQIADLKEQLQTMQTATQQRDYWGHPKKTSNKIVHGSADAFSSKGLQESKTRRDLLRFGILHSTAPGKLILSPIKKNQGRYMKGLVGERKKIKIK